MSSLDGDPGMLVDTSMKGDPGMLVDISMKDILHWTICLYCLSTQTPECQECMGTDIDPLPWAEIFPSGRETHGPCGGPVRVQE